MATKKLKNPEQTVNKYGAYLENIVVSNAVPCSPEAAAALQEAARASAAHAEALKAIAQALQGVAAPIGTGISLSGVNTPK